jgi:two-component system, LytTR family, response regulator
MNTRIIIIDDEKPARDIVRHYLKDHTDVEIIAECEDGFSGLKAINDLRPDLVFLDIQMPKLTGFEMIELLEQPPLIIFTTAYDEYAIRAFEMNATDYIMKPFTHERFSQALAKAVDKLKTGKPSSQPVQGILSTLEENPETLLRVAVKSGHKISVIPVTDIHYLGAEGDYVMIYTQDARYLKEKTMKYFETHLDQGQFIRIHRSSIVNATQIARIELYDKESYMVFLKSGVKLKASSSGYKLLKQVLNL